MPSFASYFTKQPYPFHWEQLWISQVPALSLFTCHGFITPLVLNNLAKLIVLHGLRRRYKPRQLELTIFGAIKYNTSGARHSLWPINFSVYASPVLFTCLWKIQRKRFAIPKLRHRRNTRYGWVARPCPTGTFTLKDLTSFLVALTPKAEFIGWCEPDEPLVIQAIDDQGFNQIERFFENRNGCIFTKVELQLFMVTTVPEIATRDCLFYTTLDKPAQQLVR